MRIVVVASGELDARDTRWLDGAGLVVAADGGAASLHDLGRRPDVIVGDLDSADPSLVTELEAAGTEVRRHSADKDASDTELAIDVAVEAGADEIVVCGALRGRRLDHELANILLLADPAHRDRDIRLVAGGTVVRALHEGRTLTLAGSAGDGVTLLPVGGDADGITTRGLRWALDGGTLRLGHSRGLSNVIQRPPATVRLGSGVLLVVELAAERGGT